ncbi:hypothetical protein BDV98DRAFT_178293 [Pterulicium gracile]|uniref:Uncharacterized protein n=1 Tax=Pterulicium gracile TaxID=1884261 RepID=A0A5C3QBF6_9AGAR|nr:hypothetical protein BDV98DRAFT_178293 [Pterula gracilis]
MSSDDKARMEGLQLIQSGGGLTEISPVDSLLQQANLTSLIRASVARVGPDHSSMSEVYITQLCGLAQATKNALPTWRSAMANVLDVSDGPAYLLIAFADRNTEYYCCVHQLLEELKKLQGPGVGEELDF